MEVTIKDLTTLKLSPTLIIFLKTIYNNDNEYLTHLSFNVDIWQVAKHLEKLMVIKIVGDTRECKSFEIRKLSLLEYLDGGNKGLEKDIDEVINYFMKITKKSPARFNAALKSQSSRKFIKARLLDYSVDDLKNVISLKYAQWKNDPVMNKYLRIETLMNQTKFDGYIGELDINTIKDFSETI